MPSLHQPMTKPLPRRTLPRRLQHLAIRTKIGWGLAIVGFVFLISLLAPFITPYDPIKNNLAEALQGPSLKHWFGTDNFGRDIFTRMLYAARTDLQIGIFSVIMPLLFGTLIGLLSGYYGGWLDALMMRIVDIVISFPFMVLIIAIVSILGTGLFNLFLAIFLVGWSAYARIVRAEVLIVKEQEYILAAKSLGYGDGKILFRHILPNVVTTALIFCMSDIVLCILLGASLSFLGMGVQPPTPEWGAMIAEGRNYIINAWWISTFPGLGIILTGLGFSLLGDGLAEKIENQ
ncbi:ABC transporter permease [Ammoniphilus sp. CFH 90114]|uniref:ABC transporter permease n=1 Tax=Ammoniphilus sp. CFH 90114 TaxID=2493665 RepID=UPI00196A84ED|nr:ABC transporter permease [Ammoniphilus sp. CFH 90114]